MGRIAKAGSRMGKVVTGFMSFLNDSTRTQWISLRPLKKSCWLEKKRLLADPPLCRTLLKFKHQMEVNRGNGFLGLGGGGLQAVSQ